MAAVIDCASSHRTLPAHRGPAPSSRRKHVIAVMGDRDAAGHVEIRNSAVDEDFREPMKGVRSSSSDARAGTELAYDLKDGDAAL